ncbi:YggT family protein [Actinoplanes teichomyceticus]|uniref:YggT family protein n=1 Tax=Actinoplanes teichomyceticus TaxID=1867 RepID=A0A561WA96_ACTTI|nr:YggT family protein [Actinoplanes teichomyceticus]TWG20786.1 YggT family protein [Actinoplanes teichomyceticus]GIF14441.1 hemolysin activation protein [Actinoplanes teichomyceticus]
MGLLGIIGLALLIVQFLLLARAVLDWSMVLAGPAVPGSFRSRLSGGVHAATEPILAPVRRVIPPLRAGGVSIDLAFIIVFFAVTVLRSLI